MYYIDLVVTVENSTPAAIDQEIQNEIRETKLVAKVLSYNSEEGGWPIVRYYGSEQDLTELLRTYTGEDEELIADLLGGIKKVI